MDNLKNAQRLMMEFAERTGIEKSDSTAVRYLWTDAFAVCNFLELYRRQGDTRYKDLAVTLVEQVHRVLGKEHPDTLRSGWISGLDEEEGAKHPTAAGLRIGKKYPARSQEEPYNEVEEWERDGQYFHYLTKWMHALAVIYRYTEDKKYLLWAVELAKRAYAAFTYTDAAGVRRMYWKMSTDLKYPLVTSMGQHDPLDGYVTYRALQEILQQSGLGEAYRLESEINGFWRMLQMIRMHTDDPLGIGGLLSESYFLFNLMSNAIERDEADLYLRLLYYGTKGIESFLQSGLLGYEAEQRLAFREIGLAIGLEGIRLSIPLAQKMHELPNETEETRREIMSVLVQYLPLSDEIKSYWSDEQKQNNRLWKEHQNINEVMLATSLIPEGYFI